MKFKTRQVHAGVSPDPTTGAILTPIYQSTTYVQESVDKYLAKGYSYTRSGNPTVTALESRLLSLEGGAGCACFSTGMAARPWGPLPRPSRIRYVSAWSSRWWPTSIVST